MKVAKIALSRIIILILAVVLALVIPVANPVLAAAALSVSPTTGSPGDDVTVTGSGFVASESVTLYYDSSVLTSFSADSGGNFSRNITVPDSVSGSHNIKAQGATNNVTTPFTVTPLIEISDEGGPPGTTVTVVGVGFAANERITVRFDSTTVISGIYSDSVGDWEDDFNIPPSASGYHTIDASGSVTSASAVPNLSFTVTNPAITISPTSGPSGTLVTVTGTGFISSETITITYDGASISTGISANYQGNWSGSFTVPASTSGPHVVGARGSVTLAGAVSTVSFTVTATITINPTSGSPGTSVTVAGTSFGARETGIIITFDGNGISSGIQADSLGNWSSTLIIPGSTSGSHSVSAQGPVTPAGSVSGVSFLVTPVVTISRTNGTPGDSITVSGSGFVANESITITYDGETVASDVPASAAGSWSNPFIIPASPFGSHNIRAYGSVTQVTGISGVTFKVTTPSIILSPASGWVGETVKISGFGFAANSVLVFTYDNTEIPSEGLTTDATGSFVKSLTAPKSIAGSHVINVIDWQRNTAKATFNMDNTFPPVPTLLSPADGARLSLTGGITPTFRWSEVTDPSGVTYTLQVDMSPDFSQTVLEKTGLTNNYYIVMASESLPLGQYYWRVKAIDGASNESAWSQPRLLKSGLMALWALVLIIVLAIGAVGGGIYAILSRPRARRREEIIAIPEVEMPPIAPGQWRRIETEETPRERQLPWRLALPEPAKGAKTLSTEDQARLKVIIEFAQSLPLVEPDYNVNWLVDLIETGMGIQTSAAVYDQLLKGELQVRYEPAWMHHPAYEDLTTLLQKQSILQELDTFVADIDHCASESVSLIQQMYRDGVTEFPPDFLGLGGWGFISAVYADAMNWFVGKSLRDPSERDYRIEARRGTDEETEERWLCGEETTSFAGDLILAPNNDEALRLRALHLRLRRTWRNNSQAKQIAAIVTQLQLQRNRLLNTFSQFGRAKQ